MLLYLQGASLTGPATDATGASKIANEEFALFLQDQWQPLNGLTVNYGLRWDAQLMPETIDPQSTVYGAFLSDPAFPSDGTIPDQWNMLQPRAGVAWDINAAGKDVVRASYGVYCRAPEHAVAGRIGDDQRRAAAVAVREHGTAERVWRDHPGLAGTAGRTGGCRRDSSRSSAACACSTRTTRTRASMPSTWHTSSELMPDFAGYVDFTWNEGRNLTRFLNYNRSGPSCCDAGPGTGNTYVYSGTPWGPQLGEVMVTNSLGESTYRGLTLGIRKRFSRGYQFEANYVLAKDEDNDSNERDPFTDRSFNFFDLDLDWGPADRDIRHRVNAFGYFTVPGGVQLNTRLQGAHGAADHRQPAKPQRTGSRPQRRAQGQRVLLVRLARGASVLARGRRAGHAGDRDVQHLQQRQQHQPAQHARAVQLRRVPAHRRRRPAAGPAGGEADVLDEGRGFACRRVKRR